MALRLRVLGQQATLLGKTDSKVFGVNGGTIGRAPDNDWVLPDPERYVSGHHARIEYRDGQFWVTDVSSNGTYLNDAQETLAQQGVSPLNDGDRLKIGDFEIIASIDELNDFSPDKSAIVAYDGLGSSSAVERVSEDDLGDLLDFNALLEPSSDPAHEGGEPSLESGGPSSDNSSSLNLSLSDSSSRPMAPVNAWGQSIPEAAIVPKRPRTPAPKILPEGPAPTTPPRQAQSTPLPGSGPATSPRAAASPTPAAQTPWNLATRRIEPYRNPQKDTPGAPAAGAADPGASTDLSGLQALCRGAGIDPASLPPSVQPQVLQLAGQLLREVILGLMDSLQTRTEARARYRIPQPAIQPDENNPLQFSAGVEEALRKLFEAQGKTAHSSRYLGPVEAVRESFHEMKVHHQAMLAAMHTAFTEFLGQLHPQELQERFDRGLKRSGLLAAATNKIKYWELYGELYQTLSQTPKGELPHHFVEEFSKAYEAKLTELATRRQRPPVAGAS